jgi:hypothetical protein
MQKRMPSSGMLCHMALVRTDVSEELLASFIRVTGIGELRITLAVTGNRSILHVSEERIAPIIRVTKDGELGTTLAVTSNRSTLPLQYFFPVLRLLTVNVVPSSSNLVTLVMEAIRSCETLVLTRAIRRNIPEDGIVTALKTSDLHE